MLIYQCLLYIYIYIYMVFFLIFFFFLIFILSDLNWNAEDYGFYKNEPDADIDDEKDDNEGEESNNLDLEKRSTDPKSRKGLPRWSLVQQKVRPLLHRRRRSGVRRRNG